MKRCVVLVWLVVLGLGLGSGGGVWAQSLEDQYLRIFNLIQDADAVSSTDSHQALVKYTEAQTALQALQRGSPAWNARVVGFRLNYLASRIAELSGKPVPAPVVMGATPAATPAGVPAAPSNWEEQLDALKQQVKQLQADKSLLEAKLREALAVMPAAIDPAELAKAREQVRSLQKENELLKAASTEANKAGESTAALREENRRLEKQLEAANQELSSRKGKGAGQPQNSEFEELLNKKKK